MTDLPFKMKYVDIDLVLQYLYDKVPEKVPLPEIRLRVFNNDPSAPLGTIMTLLVNEGFIHQEEGHIHIPGSPAYHVYTMTTPSIASFWNTPIPGQPYLSKKLKEEELEQKQIEEEQKKFKAEVHARKESWPKRNWLIVMLISFVLGILTPIISEALKRKIWHAPNANLHHHAEYQTKEAVKIPGKAR